MTRVAIVGGGAAGLAAAISAAREGAQVTLYESEPRMGKKLCGTGNGRCNFTNMRLSADAYNAPAFVAPTLEAHGPVQIRDWFGELGLLSVEEREGRVYPLSMSAHSVVEVLRNACGRLGVERVLETQVRNVDVLDADTVVVATGGGSTLLGSCGHTLVDFQPVLCALGCDTHPLRGLSGVRARVEAHLLRRGEAICHERGEVLFRDYGVSGIVIFDLSRLARSGDVLSLDLLPEWDEEALRDELSRRLGRFGAQTCYSELMTGMLHSRINAAVLHMAGVKGAKRVDAQCLRRIAHVCKCFQIRITGPGDVRHAQLTRGGAATDEFDALTLQSAKRPSLFAAGETLDVDGPCGGYNLHWAWASGIVAGASAAQMR